MSDDEEAPIPMGRNESASQKLHDWIKRSPHTVAVSVPIGEKKSVKLDCFCSGSAAVAEVVAKTAALGNEYIWVEASAEKLFETDSFSAFQNVKVSHSALDRVPADLQVISNRFVSEEVREAFLWSGVLHCLPRAPEFAATVTAGENQPTSSKLIGRHLLSLFPNTLLRGDKPKAVAVVGGIIRADKWRVLDQLIDLVDEIFLVGEMSLPFVALSSRIYLSKHEAVCEENRDVSLTLLQKARLRGVSLTLPIDLVQGDEQLQPSHWTKAFTNIPSDSRGEGTDYEGESKVVSIQDKRLIHDGTFTAQAAPAAALEENRIKVDGFVYDIGPESCALLKQAVSFADLLYIWGTVGVCEVAGFQNGQVALVEAANQLNAHAALETVLQSPAQLLPMAPLAKDPLRTLLLGDSTVEWFARIADSDGELGGDLPSAGLVAYCCRQTAIHSGLLGLYPANVVNGSGASHPEGSHNS